MNFQAIKPTLYSILTVFLAAVLSPPCMASGSSDLMSRIKQATGKLTPSQQVEAPITVPKNIVKATENYQGGTFYTLTRKDQIKRFNCRDCHTGKPVNILNAAAISHSDIKVAHGSAEEPLSCDTCHSKSDRNYLVSPKDRRIDFDHVYRMCGQCHFRQKKDWIGGAHGKRVTYWTGERVVSNCTSCHDPHSPRFKKQWPATYSVPLN